MFNVRLAGGHLYGKQLFTWLSQVVGFMASFVLSLFPLDVLDGIWGLNWVSFWGITYLLFLYDSFCEALDDGKEIRVVFCDISKAFDRVWHRGLLCKLKAAGVTSTALKWFQSYLSNRKQRVVLPGVLSDWKSIKAGVPQGSILGPLLFLIFINDIVSDINSNIRLFADDTTLYIIVENPQSAAIVLNADMQKIDSWVDMWLVKFNPSKSESFIVSRKLNKPYHPPIYMGNTQIAEVNTHKHLGIILSHDCSWHAHIEYIKEKAWQRINIMRRLKFIQDRKSLEIIYLSFIRPVLEYGDTIWENCTQYEKKELDKIQNEAARIVTGATVLVSLQSLYQEVGWESLQDMRLKHKLNLFFKMQHDLTPLYLRWWFLVNTKTWIKSQKFNISPWNLTDLLFLLFSTVYNAK